MCLLTPPWKQIHFLTETLLKNNLSYYLCFDGYTEREEKTSFHFFQSICFLAPIYLFFLRRVRSIKEKYKYSGYITQYHMDIAFRHKIFHLASMEASAFEDGQAQEQEYKKFLLH